MDFGVGPLPAFRVGAGRGRRTSIIFFAGGESGTRFASTSDRTAHFSTAMLASLSKFVPPRAKNMPTLASSRDYFVSSRQTNRFPCRFVQQIYPAKTQRGNGDKTYYTIILASPRPSRIRFSVRRRTGSRRKRFGYLFFVAYDSIERLIAIFEVRVGLIRPFPDFPHTPFFLPVGFSVFRSGSLCIPIRLFL